MNEIQFMFRESNVRVYDKDGNPWFAAIDVCNILGHTNPTVAIQRLDDDERAKFNLGRQGETNFVNEFGLYTLVLNSRKPEARDFKRWITHEVIPSIRKNGAYMTRNTLNQAISDPDFMIGLLQNLKKQQEENLVLVNKISSDAPKVFFAEAVADSENTISVSEMAKLISQNGYLIGQNRLFQYLRDNGYLIKRHGIDYNTPQQKFVEQGLFKIKESLTFDKDKSKIHRTTRITGKGQQYFINRFLNTDLPLKGGNLNGLSRK